VFLFFHPRYKLAEINDETEARKHGFQKGTKFKLLTYDSVALTEDEWKVAHTQRAFSNEVVSNPP